MGLLPRTLGWCAPAPAGGCRCHWPRLALGPRALHFLKRHFDQRLQAVHLVEVVDHHEAHAVAQRRSQLLLGLSVAVHHHPLRGEPGVQREVQLTAGGDVAPQPLLRERAQHRGAGERLGGVHHAGSSGAKDAQGPPAHERRARARKIGPGDDVSRRCRTRARAPRCRSRPPPGAHARSRGCPPGTPARGSAQGCLSFLWPWSGEEGLLRARWHPTRRAGSAGCATLQAWIIACGSHAVAGRGVPGPPGRSPARPRPRRIRRATRRQRSSAARSPAAAR